MYTYEMMSHSDESNSSFARFRVFVTFTSINVRERDANSLKRHFRYDRVMAKLEMVKDSKVKGM